MGRSAKKEDWRKAKSPGIKDFSRSYPSPPTKMDGERGKNGLHCACKFYTHTHTYTHGLQPVPEILTEQGRQFYVLGSLVGSWPANAAAMSSVLGSLLLSSGRHIQVIGNIQEKVESGAFRMKVDRVLAR